MITLNEIIDNYQAWETPIDDRFGRRLVQFLTEEQCNKIGFELVEPTKHQIIEYNEHNVLKQLKEDLEFAWEKACGERSISASLMVDVVEKWCKVLGNKLRAGYYEDYGKEFLRKVNDFYGWNLTKE